MGFVYFSFLEIKHHISGKRYSPPEVKNVVKINQLGLTSEVTLKL
jgi:hypothetical protein